MKQPAVLVFAEAALLYAYTALWISQLAGDAVSARGQFVWALSGGSTPEPLYRRLAQPPHRTALDWQAAHFFWGDDRLVPPDRPESNFHQAHELLLKPLAVPARNVHRVAGELSPDAAIADYRQKLAAASRGPEPWPIFDLVLLGLGADGHTASLFPSTPADVAPEYDGAPAIAVTADYEGRPAARATLTPAVMNTAHHILFLVTGANKAAAVAATLEGPYLPGRWPAQRIQADAGQVTWILDEAAGAELRDVERS